MTDIDRANETSEPLGVDKSNEEGATRSGEAFPVAGSPARAVSDGEATEERRKTVNVHNGAGRGLMLHLHKTVDDDGGGRPFQGRSLPDAVELKAGHNAGIDKEFFDAWLKQNKAFADQCGITAQDED